MRTWKAVLGVVLVFLLGMAAGGLVAVKVAQRRLPLLGQGGGSPAVRDLIVRRLGWQLRLDPGQRAQVRTAVTEAQQELQALRARSQPEARRILAGTEEKVRAVLRPDQAAKFDRLIAQQRRRWGAGPPPPARPGGTERPPP